MSRHWLLIAFTWCVPMLAQKNIWANVPADWEAVNRGREVDPSASQEQSLIKLLKSLPPPWNCDEDATGEWLKLLRYRSIPLSSKKNVFLVEAGPGCARGGQGSNGAMWLIRFDRDQPILLAGRAQEFDGYLYSVLKASSKGYSDLVLGWHISVGRAGLIYFRFDGTVYRRLGIATRYEDEKGVRIIPTNPEH